MVLMYSVPFQEVAARPVDSLQLECQTVENGVLALQLLVGCGNVVMGRVDLNATKRLRMGPTSPILTICNKSVAAKI